MNYLYICSECSRSWIISIPFLTFYFKRSVVYSLTVIKNLKIETVDIPMGYRTDIIISLTLWTTKGWEICSNCDRRFYWRLWKSVSLRIAVLKVNIPLKFHQRLSLRQSNR